MELVKTVSLFVLVSVIGTPALSLMKRDIAGEPAEAAGEDTVRDIVSGDQATGVKEESDDKEVETGLTYESFEVTIISGFVVSVAAFAFFILLRCCPPLCRQESKNLRRRYIDSQLQIGEL